jgi:hypothetical protein
VFQIKNDRKENRNIFIKDFFLIDFSSDNNGTNPKKTSIVSP